uniref:Transmembrane O-mannosyltransferase targeting cadherins 1 n=1 Tax=Oncorhynchus kisutch TaxID=8019 RepID=A0A8C7G7L7_ONCKI
MIQVSGIVGRADVLACMLFLLAFLSYVRSVGVCGSGSADSLPSTVSVWALGASLLLGTCAMLVKETGITVFGVCVFYDALVLCRKPLLLHLSGSKMKDLLRISVPFLKRACAISLYVALIMSFRLWLMGGSMPLFSEQDNPASFSPHLLTRSGIQTLPHNAKVHYNYANFLKDRGRHQEAIHHYKTALRLYPRHASAMNNLGTLTRRPEDAEHYYRTALDTNPQHNRALFNLGNLLKSQGKKEEAEALLRDSIRFGPHFADAYSSLASLYAEQKRFAEANEVYLQGIESCPDSSDLHNNYGVFLVDTGEGALAAAHYQHAVRLKPTHYVAMVNLGRLLRSSNENKEAESWYKKALQVTRKVDILTPLGALYYNTGRYEEALQVYREAATLQPDSTDIWLALAQVLAMAGRSKEAEKMTLGIISKQGSCIECYRLLSAIYSKRGNYTEALDALDKALLQNPIDMSVRAELHFSKGNQLREMNQLDRAFESYKLVVELKPDQSQAWMNMGGIQHIKGDYAAARQYYQRALILTPGSKLLKENLAKLDRLERRLTGA